jgi:hypothetical protein
MRSIRFLALGSLIAAATFGLVACAAAEDDSESGGAALTGGDGNSLDAPVVYFFATKATSSRSTKCVGALLSDTIAVTSKDCPVVGMTLGSNGANDDGSRSTVTAVHIPDGANADIALVEINPPISGAHAVITHAPLRDGYSVSATQSSNGGGFLMPQKGDPSSINGRLVSETDTQSLVQPAQGSQICAGDIGAPVCSSTRSNFGGTDVSGTCGLAGVVLGPADGAAALADGGIPADAGSSVTMVDGVRCSGGSWKVAQLGRHAAFIKQFAPEAFQPITVDNGFFGFGGSTAVPDGLWGYKTAGDVKACQITTTALPATAVSSPVSISATVSFANMQQNAVGVGRFGIAPAAAPTQMTWFAAKGTGHKSKSYNATFDGTIAGATDGDYVVAFRASANGGETWTECDIDGMANGFDPAKALPLKVGVGGPVGGTAPAATTALPDGGAAVAPAATTPSTDVSDPNASSDPGPSDTSDDSDAGTTAPAKKKKAGCATSPVGSGTGDAPAYAGFGAVLGLAALLRGRRRATRSA